VGAGLRDCLFQAIIVGETRPYKFIFFNRGSNYNGT